ncbi:MAG: hypothetical protein OHK0031_11990 [Anaerolineales bacterium]
MTQILIRRASPQDKEDWLRMRLALWPHHSPQELLPEMEKFLAERWSPVFVAQRPDGRLGGFVEGSLRAYADGCESSPVGYIEGWYVDEDLRRQGVGRALIAALEAWAREQGCAEMASDTWLDNDISRAAHLALGYQESEKLIHFCKTLGAAPESARAHGRSLQDLTALMHAFVTSKSWYAPTSARPQTPKNLAISLALESAEALEHFQWRETPADPAALAAELADVALYLLQLASVSGIDLEQAVLDKLAVNAGREWGEGEDR